MIIMVTIVYKLAILINIPIQLYIYCNVYYRAWGVHMVHSMHHSNSGLEILHSDDRLMNSNLLNRLLN